jgi:hypothetical protein
MSLEYWCKLHLNGNWSFLYSIHQCLK